MKQLKDEIKNITLYETPETDEALELIKKHSKLYNQAICICLSVTILGLMPIFFGAYNILILSAIPTGISTLIFIIVRSIELKPYKHLLRIAQNNDRLRHEARVRYKEHMKLEKEFKPYKPTLKQIEETLNLDILQKPDIKG